MDIFKPDTPETVAASVEQALKAEDEVMLTSRLAALEDKLRELPADASAHDRAKLELELARTHVGLDANEQGWAMARQCFDVFAAEQDWENAVDACDVLFQSGQEGSLSALGQGIWLLVTFPVDPELSLAMLQHVVEETPDDADGAAVAACTGVFLIDLRTEGEQRDRLGFFANQMLAQVARRHSDVETQDQFNFWVEKLELDDPDKFLPRLRNVVDVLVQDDWWIDRDELQSSLPVN